MQYLWFKTLLGAAIEKVRILYEWVCGISFVGAVKKAAEENVGFQQTLVLK